MASKLASMITERAAARADIETKILKATDELESAGTKAAGAAVESRLDSLWLSLMKIDPGCPGESGDDIQQAALKSRAKDVQHRQEGLAQLVLDDGDALGGREEIMKQYEHELREISRVLAAIAE